MGCSLKRVPLDFSAPYDETWKGYVNDIDDGGVECRSCKGRGDSPEAQYLENRWYGKVEFRSEETGSAPFTPETPNVRKLAEHNCTRDGWYYGRGETAIRLEAERLCRLFNTKWCYHLSEDDVAAILAGDPGALHDFTHEWDETTRRWVAKVPAVRPSAREVNEAAILSISSGGQWAVIRAEAARRGWGLTCVECGGAGRHYPDPVKKAAHDAWERYEPPEGDGWQMWQTVSDAPLTPVFPSASALAHHLAGQDDMDYRQWLAFIKGPGWAPTVIDGRPGAAVMVEEALAR